MPSDSAFLSGAAYAGQKREIFAEFRRGNERFSRRFRFFPKIFVPKRFSPELLKSLLSVLSLQNFSVKEREFSNEISFSDFSGLGQASALIESSLGYKPIVLNPGRQFLLEKNWAFFRAFGMESLESLPMEFPEAILPMFSEPVSATIQGLLSDGDGIAEAICQKMALSSILCVPVESLPETSQLLAETFVENALFSNGFAFERFPHDRAAWQKNGFAHNGGLGSELDFSSVWPAFFHRAFFNIGFETLNCGCCRPESFSDRNVLPSSFAETEFLSNAFFFQPFSRSFACAFHEKAPFRESREKRMREFFLSAPEAGPFFFGQREMLPLEDAKTLHASGAGRILPEDKSKLEWFCLKRGSFAGAGIAGLQEKAAEAGRLAFAEQKRASKIGDFLQTTNPRLVFFRSFSKAALSLADAVPRYLAWHNAKFFSPQIMRALLGVQETVLAKFEAFSSKNGERTVLGRSKAFVEGYSGFFLAKDFSANQKIPQPKVRILA